MPGPNAKPKQCAHCKQHYLLPCSEAEKGSCANYAYAKQFGIKKQDQ